MAPVPPCPCTSGLRYADCCRGFHRGERAAPDATALMRSRYSAFALRDVGYLWRTLHPQHPDRLRPEAEVTVELRAAASRFRYTGLDILDASEAKALGHARVLFLARLFREGKDHSFVEASDFRQVEKTWAYLGGELLPLRALRVPPSELTLATFGSLVAR